MRNTNTSMHLNSTVDFCVVQSIFGGPTLPCDWIEVRGRTAHLKNESIGHVVGSECKFKVS